MNNKNMHVSTVSSSYTINREVFYDTIQSVAFDTARADITRCILLSLEYR